MKNSNIHMKKRKPLKNSFITHSRGLYSIPKKKSVLPKKNGALSSPVISKDFFINTNKVERYKVGSFNQSYIAKAKEIKIHIVIATMIWKRHDIFEIWARGIKRLSENFPNVKIDVVVAGSEGQKSRSLVEKHRFRYIEAPNSPLGRKANLRLMACKELSPDYVLLTGSDNLFSDKYFSYILNLAKQGFDEIAPLDIYYYDTITKYAAYSNGYQNYNKNIKHRRGEPIAPGRMLSRQVLDKVEWKLWDESEDKFLDKWPRENLKKIVTNYNYFSCRENGLVMCDIKSSINMTKFIIRSNFEILNEAYLYQEIPEIKKY